MIWGPVLSPGAKEGTTPWTLRDMDADGFWPMSVGEGAVCVGGYKQTEFCDLSKGQYIGGRPTKLDSHHSCLTWRK